MKPDARTITIGTAGHIDHGKTALVKVLTGVDTDRLREEKERGITIDLGFAYWENEITIIDVPGHERFIRNMVAGVSAIDYVILVVAADDGPMPQTLEHLDILNILGIQRGICVITKTDLAEPDWLSLVESDIRERTRGTFLERSSILKVSAQTGSGIDELKERIFADLAEVPPKQTQGLFRMPIDRSFSMRGFGTVVTGTVLEGRLTAEDAVELLPSKKAVRIRGFQKHGEPSDSVVAGDRAAINLSGIEKEEVTRGDVLALEAHYSPTRRMDARLSLLQTAPGLLKDRSRVRLHVGTSEVMARIRIFGAGQIKPGESSYVQLQLESAVSAFRGDRFVIRRYSPLSTLGGGTIIDPYAETHRRGDPRLLDHLEAMETGSAEDRVLSVVASSSPLLIATIERRTFVDPTALESILTALEEKDRLLRVGSRIFQPTQMDALRDTVSGILDAHHRTQPLSPGIRRLDLRNAILATSSMIDAEAAAEDAISGLIDTKFLRETDGLLSLETHTVKMSAGDEKNLKRIEALFTDNPFQPPDTSEVSKTLSLDPVRTQDYMNFLENRNALVRVGQNLYFSAAAVANTRQMLVDFLSKNDNISVSQFREILSTTRKYALPLLKYFDEQNVTVRDGNLRILND